MAAAALGPQLMALGRGQIPETAAILEAITSDRQRIRVFFRPEKLTGLEGFFYVAAAPSAPNRSLDEERAELIATGVLGQLAESCVGNEQLTLRYLNADGDEEVLTSLTPVTAKEGCFVILTSTAALEALGSTFRRSYGFAPEVQIAASAYGLLVVVVLSVFLGVWGNLNAFARLARQIRPGVIGPESFSGRNRVKELSDVAAAFDGMVERLKDAAAAIRQGAEDHAHAFKTPIAVISQSLEPLRRGLNQKDERGHRAVEMIERSVARLDELVAATRRIDQAIALSVDPPRQRLDFSTLVAQLVEDYRDASQLRGITIQLECEPKLSVLAGEDLLEAVVENLLDNAIDFSPTGGQILVNVKREGLRAALTVADQGPGVAPDQLPRLFTRYYTRRLPSQKASGGGNSGLGLWIVKRSIESIGGEVRLANRASGGLSVRIEAPMA